MGRGNSTKPPRACPHLPQAPSRCGAVGAPALCDWHVPGQWTLVYNPRCALALHALAVLEHRVRLRFDQAPPPPFSVLTGHVSSLLPY